MTRLKGVIKQKFGRDLMWLMGSNVVLAGCGISINILISHYYDANGFGTYSLALRVYLIASLVAGLGLGASVVKHVAQHKEQKDILNQCISAALLVALISSFIIMAIGLFAAPFISRFFNSIEMEQLLFVFFTGLPLFALNKIFTGILNGLRDIKVLSIIKSVRWLFLLLITIAIIVLFDKSLTYVVWSFPVTELIIFMSLLFYTSRFYSFSFSTGSWVKEHYRFGSKSMLSTAVIDLYNYLDVFVIGFFMDFRAVGIYSFASDIAKNLLVVADGIQTNFNPIISELWSKQHIEGLRDHIKRIKNITYLIYAPLIMLAITGYIIFIRFILGSDFEDSIVPFLILSLGIGIFSGFKPFAGMLEMTGHPEDRLRLNFVTLIVNFSLNILLINLWGINGVALATSVSFLVTIVMLNYYTAKRLNIKLY